MRQRERRNAPEQVLARSVARAVDSLDGLLVVDENNGMAVVRLMVMPVFPAGSRDDGYRHHLEGSQNSSYCVHRRL
jgi:hypothetical protein